MCTKSDPVGCTTRSEISVFDLQFISWHSFQRNQQSITLRNIFDRKLEWFGLCDDLSLSAVSRRILSWAFVSDRDRVVWRRSFLIVNVCNPPTLLSLTVQWKSNLILNLVLQFCPFYLNLRLRFEGRYAYLFANLSKVANETEKLQNYMGNLEIVNNHTPFVMVLLSLYLLALVCLETSPITPKNEKIVGALSLYSHAAVVCIKTFCKKKMGRTWSKLHNFDNCTIFPKTWKIQKFSKIWDTIRSQWTTISPLLYSIQTIQLNPQH